MLPSMMLRASLARLLRLWLACLAVFAAAAAPVEARQAAERPALTSVLRPERRAATTRVEAVPLRPFLATPEPVALRLGGPRVHHGRLFVLHHALLR
jgi:hypothetical protein